MGNLCVSGLDIARTKVVLDFSLSMLFEEQGEKKDILQKNISGQVRKKMFPLK